MTSFKRAANVEINFLNPNPKSLIFNSFLNFYFKLYNIFRISVRFTPYKYLKLVCKYISILLLITCFYSSTLRAQNTSLNVIGANDEETKIIETHQYKKTHTDYNSIQNEIDSLQQKIINSGYIESEINSTRKINDSSFQVKFSLNNKYESIDISYDITEIEKDLIKTITEKSSNKQFSVPLNKLEETLKFINLQIVNNGFPFTKIKLSELKIKDSKTLTANLIIVKDEKKRRLDKVVIKGYEKFPKSFLNRFLKIKPEKTFNIESIKRKMDNLNNLRFAEQTKNPEVLFSKDSTTLYIYLQKSQSNTFDGFLGFSTNEETNKLDFNGYLNLELNNNFNYGESFRLMYKSDESEQKNFEVNLNLPYIFSSPIGTELSLNILKRDSTFTTVNQKASVFYQINPKNRIYVGIESVESNNLLDVEINSLSLVSDYKSNLYNIKYTYNNRQNFKTIFQLKSSFNLEYGLGERQTKNNKEKQNRINLDAFHVFQLNNKNSFYTRITGSLINSSSYLDNELFRFGGINSIRGFQENSIAANQYIVLNTEYRYQLSKSIYAHSIIDFANFENRIIETKENLYGFGVGFGILTKAGLLRFNFANGKTEEQSFKFSNSKIHLSLVSIF